MVSWEFPPQLIGGLGRHVGALVPALRARGHDVRVITPSAAPVLSADQLLDQVTATQPQLLEQGARFGRAWSPDLVHGHDWLTGPAAAGLAQSFDAPLVTTIHATEAGRHQGYLPTDLARAVHARELALTQASARVLVCSAYMAAEVDRLFHVSAEVIGNGCSIQPTPGPTEPDLIAFAGRLVHEKGVQELIKALPELRTEFPRLRCAIAGAGPLLAAQQDRADRYGVADLVHWLGFLDPAATAALLARAAVVVVPSLYEPFGLVALEAQAVGTPVAVADAGGLRELVRDGVTGVRFAPESPTAIAGAVRWLLGNPTAAQTMAKTALEQARTRFSWTAVAARVEAAYQSLLG